MRFVKLCVLMLITINLAKAQTSPHTLIITKAQQQATTPDEALERLILGNQRFISGKMKNRDLLVQASELSPSQHPLVVILSCMDSRTPPEIIFDQGIGSVFTIRIAGNVLNNDILGSMEFGTKLAGAKLIAVIGHTSCGAIRGACEHAQLGFLTNLLKKIKPAIINAEKEQETHDCADAEFIDQVAKENVLLVMKQIVKESPTIAKLVKDHQIKVVGGLQELSSGKVEFFN